MFAAQLVMGSEPAFFFFFFVPNLSLHIYSTANMLNARVVTCDMSVLHVLNHWTVSHKSECLNKSSDPVYRIRFKIREQRSQCVLSNAYRPGRGATCSTLTNKMPGEAEETCRHFLYIKKSFLFTLVLQLFYVCLEKHFDAPDLCVSGMSGEVPPGNRRPPKQGTVDGLLSPAGQLHPCSAAQPQTQTQPGGRIELHHDGQRLMVLWYKFIQKSFKCLCL